jgi:hypothetical protein
MRLPALPGDGIGPESTKPMRIFWTYATVGATRTMIATGEIRTIDAEHGHPPTD